MKKISAAIFSFTIITCFIIYNLSSFYTVNAASITKPPVIYEDGAILMDAATGTILYGKNINASYPPASTTKLMTALLTLEKADLNAVVTIGKNPPLIDGSRIGIKTGEKITVKNLLYGLLLRSGNDCAEALAEYVGGTRENFVAMMNEKAAELGCKNTHYVNPSGLYDKNHYMSAYDLALIMKAVSSLPEFRTISSTVLYTIPATNLSPARVLENENKLIKKYSADGTKNPLYYEGADGGKTGYTIQSQFSYVATSVRNNQRLIVAMVHGANKTYWQDTINLFNYGFNNYELSKFISKGDKINVSGDRKNKLNIVASEDFYYVKPKGSNAEPSYTFDASNLVNKSFNKGDKLGTVYIKLDGKTIGTLYVESGSDHIMKLSRIFSRDNSFANNILFDDLRLCGFSLCLYLFLRIVMKIRNRKKKLVYYTKNNYYNS